MKTYKKPLEILKKSLYHARSSWSSGFKNPYAFYSTQLSGETVSKNVFKKYELQEARLVRIHCDSKCQCQGRFATADIFNRIVIV